MEVLEALDVSTQVAAKTIMPPPNRKAARCGCETPSRWRWMNPPALDRQRL
jgi:hypothetical protein